MKLEFNKAKIINLKEISRIEKQELENQNNKIRNDKIKIINSGQKLDYITTAYINAEFNVCKYGIKCCGIQENEALSIVCDNGDSSIDGEMFITETTIHNNRETTQYFGDQDNIVDYLEKHKCYNVDFAAITFQARAFSVGSCHFKDKNKKQTHPNNFLTSVIRDGLSRPLILILEITGTNAKSKNINKVIEFLKAEDYNFVFTDKLCKPRMYGLPLDLPNKIVIFAWNNRIKTFNEKCLSVKVKTYFPPYKAFLNIDEQEIPKYLYIDEDEMQIIQKAQTHITRNGIKGTGYRNLETPLNSDTISFKYSIYGFMEGYGPYILVDSHHLSFYNYKYGARFLTIEEVGKLNGWPKNLIQHIKQVATSDKVMYRAFINCMIFPFVVKTFLNSLGRIYSTNNKTWENNLAEYIDSIENSFDYKWASTRKLQIKIISKKKLSEKFYKKGGLFKIKR